MNPLVGYVGAAMKVWVTNGLVTQASARAFDEALLEAGAELALAPQVQARDHKAAAAKPRGSRAARANRHDDGRGSP